MPDTRPAAGIAFLLISGLLALSFTVEEIAPSRMPFTSLALAGPPLLLDDARLILPCLACFEVSAA